MRIVSLLALLVVVAVGCAARAASDVPFSQLPLAEQSALRRLVEPPPLATRVGPYSTPMYYLMYRGYSYEGNLDTDPDNRMYKQTAGKVGAAYGSWTLDRNRPDWQEMMVRNWADLGLNSTHLNIYPVDNQLSLQPEFATAIRDFVALSEKYGLKVGVRLDSLDETKLWTMHKNNPQNRREEYLAWVGQVAGLLKGKTAYYVLGDELTLRSEAEATRPEHWTAPMYLDYFKQVSGAIKAVDPGAKVSMFGASSGEWFNVLWMLENGYAEVGDGVAINHYDYNAVPKFIADRDRLAPGKLFLTNGVGYISAGTASPRYPDWDPYTKQQTEAAHAAAIARTMFTWWDVGADVAPYYISLRSWRMDGKVYPRWYGFFGFEDYVVEGDKLRVERYPAWYAFQAIAQTFYNRADMRTPPFEINTGRPISTLRAFLRPVPGGEELLLMLWDTNVTEAAPTTVEIASDAYAHPVRVSLKDYRQWEDVPSVRDSRSTRLDVSVGSEPVIIRLFRTTR